MGENFYFASGGSRAAHSFIADTCTNCHMELTPPPADLSHNLGGTNHLFSASPAVCTNCHGAYDGGTLQEAAAFSLHDLGETWAEAVLAKLETAGTVYIDEFDPITEATTPVAIDFGVEAANIDHPLAIESHGRMGIEIVMLDATVYHSQLRYIYTTWTDANTDGIIDDGELSGPLFDAGVDAAIAKAGWNYFLLHADGSNGVHNPSFTFEVINASLDALTP